MENKEILILVVTAIALLGLFLISVTAKDDENTIELSDDEAEEYRKRLVEREEKDVELDKED